MRKGIPAFSRSGGGGMPVMLHVTLVLWLLLVCLWSSTALYAGEGDQALHTGKASRWALVIGNGNYPTAPLRNPVNDARDMAKALCDVGFVVTELTDAGSKDMEKAIRKFGKELTSGGIGLFYYAGHGIQVGGQNYLVPVDAKIETESDVKYEAINAGRVLGKMEDAGNDFNIVILDACRNNPFGRGFRSHSQGLARMDAPRGSLIAYATAPGSVAADGTDSNGVYTKHLLEAMKVQGLTFKTMRDDR